MPPRRLLVFFLLRQCRLTGWRTIILGPSLQQLLGSCQASAWVVLYLGVDQVQELRLVCRELFAIFRQILDNFHSEQGPLQRAYYY